MMDDELPTFTDQELAIGMAVLGALSDRQVDGMNFDCDCGVCPSVQSVVLKARVIFGVGPGEARPRPFAIVAQSGK
jgi:hypothetical protein